MNLTPYTSADPNSTRCMPTDKVALNVPYREVIGLLMFLTVVSRPNLSYYDKSHWESVKRVLRYLRGSHERGILYKRDKNELCVKAFSGADYAGDRDECKSTSGCLVMLSMGPVLWFSRRQSVVVLSMTEAEYIASCIAAREIVWLRRYMSEIGFRCEEATELCIDNKGAIQLAKQPACNRSTKHIEIEFHFIKKQVGSKQINIEYVKSEEQLADIFTKSLTIDKFCKLRNNIDIV